MSDLVYDLTLQRFVDTSSVIQTLVPTGGTTGQSLIKNSSTDYDVVWGNDYSKVTANIGITPSTATKITFDSKGLVTLGEIAVISDIPDLANNLTTIFNELPNKEEVSNKSLNIAVDATSDVFYPSVKAVATALSSKQDTLNAGTNITIVGNTISSSGSGDTTVTEGALINSATAKTTPIDADHIGLMDSAASNILKKLNWSNIKVTLKSYFDTLYVSLTGIKTLNSISLVGTGDISLASLLGECVLLLHGEGTNGGTTITDDSTYGFVPSGISHIVTSNAQVQYGSTSLKFHDGISNFLYANVPQLGFFSLPWTVEFYIKSAAYSNGDKNLAVNKNTVEIFAVIASATASNTVSILGNTAIDTTVSASQWIFIRVAYEGSGVYKVYADGVYRGTTTDTTVIDDNLQFKIIGSSSVTNVTYFEEFRVLKGIALTTGLPDFPLTSTLPSLVVTGTEVINQTLTGFTASSGTVTSSDSILQAFQKIVGNVATAALTSVANIWTKMQYNSQLSVTSSLGTLTLDLNLRSEFIITLTEDTFFANPTNLAAGQNFNVTIIQHAATPKIITFDTKWVSSSGLSMNMPVTLEALAVLTCHVNTANHITYYLANHGVT